MSLSAIVITKNARKKLEQCLRSLQFCDEIIVVDSGSTDVTFTIAKKSGARIIKTMTVGYAENRNLGAKHAKCDWLLYIDSDEVVSNALQQVILRLITDHQSLITSYRIFRKNIILNKWLRHGGWWPDPVHRLMK